MPMSRGQFTGTLPGLTLKAWAQFSNQGALIKGFNVTSVVPGTVGVNLVTFTAAMATTNYIAHVYEISGNGFQAPTPSVGTKATGSCQIIHYGAGAPANTLSDIYVAFYE